MIFAFPKGISKMLKFLLCSIVPLALTAANFLLCFHWRYVFHSEGKLVGGKLFFCICQVVNFSFFTGSFDKAIGKGFINAWLRSLPFTVHFISKGNSNHAPLQSETSEGRAGLGGWEQDVRYGWATRNPVAWGEISLDLQHSYFKWNIISSYTRYHLQTKGPIFSTREKRSQQKPSLKQLAKMQTIKIWSLTSFACSMAALS